jgi:lysyl-tRNA synthetase class 2
MAIFAACSCRQRYLDLIVSDEARATFRARSKVITAIRRHLEDQGFLEVGEYAK